MQTDNDKYNETVQPNTAFLNELKDKLPEFTTKDGFFDLGKFKNALKKKNINELNEGYQLNFIGKDYARRQAGEMPTTVIVPDERQNRGDGIYSQNLFFTGDNLEVLRHLQNNYQNKIDLIYIDPPYNTGQDDFAYPDNFEYTDDQLEDMFGLDDDQLARLKSIQGKSSHSAWLTFMYPRLQLAKYLLKRNGVIFISIDDNEDGNLKEICDEIFGENNFLAQVIWERAYAPINLKKIFHQVMIICWFMVEILTLLSLVAYIVLIMLIVGIIIRIMTLVVTGVQAIFLLVLPFLLIFTQSLLHREEWWSLQQEEAGGFHQKLFVKDSKIIEFGLGLMEMVYQESKDLNLN